MPHKKGHPAPKKKPPYATGVADRMEAQIKKRQGNPPRLADRQPEVYVPDDLAAKRKADEKARLKAIEDAKKNKGGGGASTALTEAQRLANELARLKIQAEYDKADREAQEVLDDR